MQNDEQAIRELFANWRAATKKGDLSSLLKLMAEDAVFLTPGQPLLIGRAAFAEASEQTPTHQHIVPNGVIEELEIVGDWAYCRTYLTVTVTPGPDGAPLELSGHTLTILRKQADGQWVVARDANLLTPNSPATH